MLKESPATPMAYVIKGRREFFKSKAVCKAFPAAEFDEKTSYSLCISGIQAPFGNAVWQESLPLENGNEAELILERMNKKRVPFFWWQAALPINQERNHGATPPPLIEEILAKRGFHRLGLLTGIVADLDARISVVAPSKSLSIRRVASSDDLSLFCKIIFSIHSLEQPIIDQIYTLLAHPAVQGHEAHFLAFEGDQAVGGITLALGQTAGLWNFAILPEMRHKGIGTALIQTALQDAQRRGYQKMMAILMSGEPRTLWERLHFREVCHFPCHISPG